MVINLPQAVAEIAEKVEEDNDGETGMIIREWAEKYRTKGME